MIAASFAIVVATVGVESTAVRVSWRCQYRTKYHKVESKLHDSECKVHDVECAKSRLRRDQMLRIEAISLSSLAPYHDPSQPMAAPNTLTINCLQ